MKNGNIKLHSNIMKIFKYLVFIMSFIFISFALNSNTSLASTTTGGDGGGGSSNEVMSYEGNYVYFHNTNAVYKYSTFYSKKNLKKWTFSATKVKNEGCYPSIKLSFKNSNGLSLQEYAIDSTTKDTLNEITVSTTGTVSKITITIQVYYYYDGLVWGIGAGCKADSKKSLSYDFDVKIDTTAPYIDTWCKITGSNYSDCATQSNEVVPYTKSYSVRLSFSDDGARFKSGWNPFYYCLVKSTTEECTTWGTSNFASAGSFSVSGTGKFYLRIKVQDALGNEYNDLLKSTKGKNMVLYLDDTAPSISIVYPQNYNKYKKEHVFTVNVSDANSGVAEKYYCLSKEKTNSKCSGTSDTIEENRWMKFTGNTIKLNSLSGKYYLYIRAKDKVGNVRDLSTGEDLIYLDNTIPVLERTITTGFNEWTNNAEITINVKDVDSGVSKVKLCYKEGLSGSADDYKSDCKGTYVYEKDSNSLGTGDSEYITVPISMFKDVSIAEGLYACIFIFDSVLEDEKNEYKNCGPLKIDTKKPTIDVATSFRDGATTKDEIPYLNPNDVIKYTLTIEDYVLGILENILVPTKESEVTKWKIDDIIQKNPYDSNYSTISCNFEFKSVSKISSRIETRNGNEIEIATAVQVVYAVSCSKTTKLKVAFSVVDEVGNASEFASYGSFVSEFYIDGNGGVTVGGGEVVDGDFKGLFDIIKKKGNAAPQNKQIKIVEEVEIVEVQIKDNKLEIKIVEDEDTVNVEYSIENEEYKVLEDNIVELGNNDIYHLSVRANLVNDILEKKFLVLKEKEKFVLKRLA